MARSVRILLILPETLLRLVDEAAQILQMSRLALIRQAIMGRVSTFQNTEKKAFEALLEPESLFGMPFVMGGALWRRDDDDDSDILS